MTAEQDAIERLFRHAEEMEQRSGRDGGTRWCFQCGADGPVERCACKFPEPLRCAGGRHLCERCRSAHVDSSDFFTTLLRTHPSPSPHSRRAKLHLRLYRALEGLENGKNVRHFIAQTDGGDDDDKFRLTVLGAFSKASFLDFAGLARGLERELDREEKAAALRSIYMLENSGLLAQK